MLKIKRAYEPAETSDGRRILIDRLWPRGVSKADARIDAWLKDLSPSTELREWFAHDQQKWEEFRKKYRQELSAPEKARLIEDIAQHARHNNVTLIFSAKDIEHNDALVLEELIQKSMVGVHA